MSVGAVAAAALLLSIKRLCYLGAWRRPESFRRWLAPGGPRGAGDPVAALERLFYTFKAIQIAVFLAWCSHFGAGVPWPGARGAGQLTLGALALVAGQALNFAVFLRLGRDGVFYGNRFGRDVAWCARFPFSLLAHPQYVGAVLSIWGFFLLVRFPEPDWIVLPAIETAYYAIGARFESDRRLPGALRQRDIRPRRRSSPAEWVADG